MTDLDLGEDGDLAMGEAPKDVVTTMSHRILQVSLMLLATVIVLNLTVAYLRPLLPWIGGGAAVALLLWTVVGVVRWRRSRW